MIEVSYPSDDQDTVRRIARMLNMSLAIDRWPKVVVEDTRLVVDKLPEEEQMYRAFVHGFVVGCLNVFAELKRSK
jgi:hypothetical protein